MHPDEPVVEKDAIQLESDILVLFANMKNPKVKKVVKLAQTLMLEKTHRVEQRLLKDIAFHADPVGFVKRSWAVVNDFGILTEQFIEDGYHAMIIEGHDIYPVHVKAPAHWLVREWKWSPDQEADIEKEVVDAFLEAYDRDYFYGKVMLFSHCGFSGIPRVRERRREMSKAA